MLLTVVEIISADVAVSVRIPPIIFDNSTRSVVVSEGQAVKLECYAGGFPLPTVIIAAPVARTVDRTSIRNV